MVILEFSPIVNYTLGNECPNTTHRALDVCLFSNVTLQCTFLPVNDSQLDVEWMLYPHNTSLNSSNNNDTSSTMFTVSQENVFFLIAQTASGSTISCPLCNISLDITQSTASLINATQAYCKSITNKCTVEILWPEKMLSQIIIINYVCNNYS